MQPRFISRRRKDGLFWLMEDVRHCIVIMMEWEGIECVRGVVSEKAFPRSAQG